MKEPVPSNASATDGADDELHTGDDKTPRRTARKMITAYHDEQLRLLLDHFRDGFAKLGAGEWLRAARHLVYLREGNDDADWGEAATSGRDR